MMGETLKEVGPKMKGEVKIMKVSALCVFCAVYRATMVAVAWF